MPEADGQTHMKGSAEVALDVAKFADKIEQLEPRDVIRELMIGFASRQTMGPDAETAAVFAETERHAEEARLEAYRENLKHRDRQSGRDHDFCIGNMRSDASNTRIVLAIAVLLGGAGMWLLALRGQTAIGSNLPVFSAGLIYTALSGKNPFEKQ